MLQYEVRISYDPEKKKASYRIWGEGVRRLNAINSAQAMSVLLTIAVNELTAFKGYTRRGALRELLYSAGLDDISEVRKGVI